MAATGSSSTTDCTEIIEQCRETLQTSKLGADFLLDVLVTKDVVTTVEAANTKELSTEASARNEIDFVLDLVISKGITASENFFQAIQVHEPWIIDELQLQGIPVSQFLECDELTSEVDKLKVSFGNSAPPESQGVSEPDPEKNWKILLQMSYRKTDLQFRKSFPTVPVVEIFFDSGLPEIPNDPVAKYMKQSVYTDGRVSENKQFATYENFVYETRGAVGIVTTKKPPVAKESEAIFQMFECLRSNCSSFVLALNYDTYLSTQAEKARVLKDLLEHCRGKTTAEYIRIARELSSSMVFPTSGDRKLLHKHINSRGLQTCKRIAERRSPSSVKDVENMIKALEEKNPNTPLPDTAKSNLFKLPFVKGFCVIADTPHIYIHEEKFRKRDAHKQVCDIVSPYFGDNYVILEYSDQAVSFQPLVSAKPGAAVFCDGDSPNKFGTLGALLKVTQESGAEEHDWYALTCSHVVEKCELMKLKKEGDTSLVLGKVVYRRKKKRKEKDVALIKVDSSLCPESNGGHINVRQNMEGVCEQKVRKIGAVTGETHGIVIGRECEFPEYRKYGKDFIVLCAETPSVRFAEGGDSGSLVLMEDDCKVEALSILVGEIDNLRSPYLPPNTPAFYSDNLTDSLKQIEIPLLKNKVLSYIDEVSKHHSLLFVCSVDITKEPVLANCMLCHHLRHYCRKGGRDNILVQDSAGDPHHRERLLHGWLRYRLPKFPLRVSAMGLNVQQHKLAAEENQEQDAVPDHEETADEEIRRFEEREWKKEFRNDTKMTFSEFCLQMEMLSFFAY